MPVISTKHTAIKAVTEAGFYSFNERPNLFLRVTKTGARSWMYRSRVGGVARWINIGNAETIPFATAEEKASMLREQARQARGQGEDANPIEAQRRAKAATAARKRKQEQDEALRPTLDKIAEQYIGVFVAEKRRRDGAKRWKDDEQAIYDREISPRLGAFKVGDIKSRDVAAMRNEIKSESGKRKAVAVLRALLSHAKSDGQIDSNPALGIKVTPSGQRARVLTRDEIKALWAAKAVDGTKDPDDKTAVEGVRATMLAAVKVQLATAQRAGEVLNMRWSDLTEQDGERWWTIPAAIAKNGREHIVPLSPQVWALIEAQRPAPDADPEKVSPYVFAAKAGSRREKPVSTSDFAHVIAKVRAELGLGHFTSHDLRRSAATKMAEAGVLPHVIEAALNHITGARSGVAGIYNRASYHKEKRSALVQWAKALDRIVKDEGGPVVVQFPARAKA